MSYMDAGGSMTLKLNQTGLDSMRIDHLMISVPNYQETLHMRRINLLASL